MRGARGAAASQRCRSGRRARRRSRGTGLSSSASARGRLPGGAQQRSERGERKRSMRASNRPASRHSCTGQERSVLSNKAGNLFTSLGKLCEDSVWPMRQRYV